MASNRIADLPSALDRRAGVIGRLGERRPAVFLDYDGTLTPIVDHPEDAVITDAMREAVRRLARRCPVCVVSGRDRSVVQSLIGLDELVVAGSHGFDIWSPSGGPVGRDVGERHRDLVEAVARRLRRELSGIDGAVVEAKAGSVAAHHRLVADAERSRVIGAVDGIIRDHPGELRVTPGKMVLEILPDIEWDKGRAVLHLLCALGLDDAGVMPIYIGDDITDEDAFRALDGRGPGVLVSDGDSGCSDGTTGASHVLRGVAEVEELLRSLAEALDGAAGQPKENPGPKGLKGKGTGP